MSAEGLTPSIPPRVAVLSLFGMMNWVYKWHNPEIDPGAEEVTNGIVSIFLNGVLEEKAALYAAGARARTGD
jgi:hypothetical protein